MTITKECFMQDLDEIGPMTLEKMIFEMSLNYFRKYVVISPLKYGGVLLLKKLEFP